MLSLLREQAGRWSWYVGGVELEMDDRCRLIGREAPFVLRSRDLQDTVCEMDIYYSAHSIITLIDTIIKMGPQFQSQTGPA